MKYSVQQRSVARLVLLLTALFLLRYRRRQIRASRFEESIGVCHGRVTVPKCGQDLTIDSLRHWCCYDAPLEYRLNRKNFESYLAVVRGRAASAFIHPRHHAKLLCIYLFTLDTRRYYQLINKALRRRDQEELDNLSLLINGVISGVAYLKDRTPLPPKLVLFRGGLLSCADTLSHFHSGHAYTDSFLSASRSIDSAVEFHWRTLHPDLFGWYDTHHHRRCRMVVLVRWSPGDISNSILGIYERGDIRFHPMAADISQFSVYPEEREVLFCPNQRYELLNVVHTQKDSLATMCFMERQDTDSPKRAPRPSSVVGPGEFERFYRTWREKERRAMLPSIARLWAVWGLLSWVFQC
eukprot:Rmarinus@m.30072